MFCLRLLFRRILLALLLTGSCAPIGFAQQPAGTPSTDATRAFVNKYCVDCHNRDEKTAGLALDDAALDQVAAHTQLWEKVVRKLRVRHMPPAKMPRPDEQTYQTVVSSLEAQLDRAAAEHPNPGRTETFRRLNRTEYQNTIRDLLAIDIDATTLLPADESSHGFDNITITDLSPTLLNRYVSAAQKISRLAVGRAPRTPGGETFRIRADVTQDTHIAGLPLGTRGGTLINYNFPVSGEYEIQIRLMRDRNDAVESLRDTHELEVLLDRERVELLTVKPAPRGQSDETVDANLKTRFKAPAGAHQVGVAFLKQRSSLLESERQPLNVHFNFYRHPRLGPAIYEVSIIGPFEATGPGDTPSRQRIFICRPTRPSDEEACANRIIANLARRAYRRAVSDDDLEAPLELYREARKEGDFEAGIEAALSAILVNPQFLLRIERNPSGAAPGTVYRLKDAELASRLSYFLWSSMPDDELLELAIASQLSRPDVLKQQVRRMLVDDRSRSLVTNFGGQWLHLRNLDAFIPDMRLFQDFDDNLRQAMRRETELLLDSVVREDRCVLDLIKADYTYLNERLARHYGIPHVFGSQFRKVALETVSHRGGLLRQASVLAVTSYPTRTSPVIRGKWILENILGTPPPPPPGNVPALKDNMVASNLSVRERLQQHRADQACAGCHSLMDPAGFALENYDAIGRWRETEEGLAVDATGGLPDGSEFLGVTGLEQSILARPEMFVGTLSEKLLTFALGRGVESYDAPAVRRIVRDARQADYHVSSLILGIATSTPFQMRRSE
jgi:mono/diheme cytochrome c family protein